MKGTGDSVAVIRLAYGDFKDSPDLSTETKNPGSERMILCTFDSEKSEFSYNY